jgi:hypothetical protein
MANIKKRTLNELRQVKTYGYRQPQPTKYPPLRFEKEFLTKKQIDDIEYVSKNIVNGLTIPPSDKDTDKMPNQKRYQIVSFIKSGVRIVGYPLYVLKRYINKRIRNRQNW